MKMTLEQTQIVGLTMQLDLKAREYEKLCKKIDKLKEKNIDPNDPQYEELLNDLIKNNQEIREITNKLKELNSAKWDYIKQTCNFFVEEWKCQ